MRRENNLWWVVQDVLSGAQVQRHEDGGICPDDAHRLARDIEARYDVPSFGRYLDDMGAECLVGNTLIEHKPERGQRFFRWWRYKRTGIGGAMRCKCGHLVPAGEMFEYHQAQQVMRAVWRNTLDGIRREREAARVG
jgi:hypothetical protein